MVNTIYLFRFVKTPRKFIIAKLSIHISSDLHQFSSDPRIFNILRTDEDPSLRIKSFAIINLRGVSAKLNKYKTLLFQIHYAL